MIIKTDRVELEILPGESVFVGIKDERGQDAEAVFQAWTELAPFRGSCSGRDFG